MLKKFIGLIFLCLNTPVLATGISFETVPNKPIATEIKSDTHEDPFAIRVFAGLGNQMFLLASQFAYAKKFNKKICLREPFNPAFDVPIRLCSDDEIKKARQKSCRFYRFSPSFFQQDDCLEIPYDYLQDERFFANERDTIKKMFRFVEPLPETISTLANEIRRKNSVAVHIRRTDYLKYPTLYPIMTLDYYMAGADYIQNHSRENIHLFVFSDDTDWVSKNFKSRYPFTIVSGNSATTDLHLMSLCRHNIIANSTFSWWGAYLNKNPNKIVVAPDTWNLQSPQWGKDIILKDWIVMPIHPKTKDKSVNVS